MVCATDSRHTKGRLNFGNLTIPYRVFFTYVDSHHSSTDQEAASDAAWTSVCKEILTLGASCYWSRMLIRLNKTCAPLLTRYSAESEDNPGISLKKCLHLLSGRVTPWTVS